jgi:hypothetical protein
MPQCTVQIANSKLQITNYELPFEPQNLSFIDFLDDWCGLPARYLSPNLRRSQLGRG